MSIQITSFYVLKIKTGFQYNALTKMAYAATFFRRVPGCTFAKIMGTGGGELGFGLIPNFKIYTAILTWESPEFLRNFENSHWLFKRYEKISSSIQRIYGSAYQSHGKWDGIQPFQVTAKIEVDEPKIIVLTRARIRLKEIKKFWDFVPNTSDALNQIKGRIFSLGIGEFPLILQATLSVWESQAHMRDYAYKNEHHLAAIKKTKETNWYSEELFARFIWIEDPFN